MLRPDGPEGSAILNISHNFPSGWGIVETSLLLWFYETLSCSLQMEVGTFVSGHPLPSIDVSISFSSYLLRG